MPDTPTNSLSSPLLAMTSPTSMPILGPGEVIKNSGKFTKPTRIPGKNYCKDEVVIRNSDSGKGKLIYYNNIYLFYKNFTQLN